MFARTILATGLVALCLQWAFTLAKSEPYPSFRMPSFSGSGGYKDGKLTFQNYDAVFVADGEEIAVSPRTLFEQFPDSHLAEFSSNLRPSDKPAHSSVVAFLAGRAAALAPGRTVKRVEFRWYEATIEGGRETERRPVGIRTVSIAP